MQWLIRLSDTIVFNISLLVLPTIHANNFSPNCNNNVFIPSHNDFEKSTNEYLNNFLI